MEERPALAVLGLRPHTYWTAAVALAGPADAPQVLERRRIVFAAGEERSVYHRAAECPPGAAEALLVEVRAATKTNAVAGIATLIADLEASGVAVRIAAAPDTPGRIPERLADILASHAHVHAAEGRFYRDVVADACAATGLEVRRVIERELADRVAERLGVDAADIAERLRVLGAALGPPWSEDQKLATLAAWLHL
jgi:hypothetical protein